MSRIFSRSFFAGKISFLQCKKIIFAENIIFNLIHTSTVDIIFLVFITLLIIVLIYTKRIKVHILTAELFIIDKCPCVA